MKLHSPSCVSARHGHLEHSARIDQNHKQQWLTNYHYKPTNRNLQVSVAHVDCPNRFQIVQWNGSLSCNVPLKCLYYVCSLKLLQLTRYAHALISGGNECAHADLLAPFNSIIPTHLPSASFSIDKNTTQNVNQINVCVRQTMHNLTLCRRATASE